MESLRVYELARLLEVGSREVIDELSVIGIDITSASNALKSEHLDRAITHYYSQRDGDLPSPLLNLLKPQAESSVKVVRPPIPASAFRVNPQNLADFLERAKDNDTLALEAGDYKGPFLLNRPLTLIGEGINSVIFTSSEPAVKVTSPGVRLEYLSLERTNGGEGGAVVLESSPGCEPVLSDVYLLGSAPGAKISDACWEIPAMYDCGQILAGFSHTSELTVKVAEESWITTTLPSLVVSPSYVAPGQTTLKITINGSAALAGNRMLAAFSFMTNNGESRSVSVTAEYVAPPASVPQNTKVVHEQIHTTTWGVIFEKRAAQQFMRLAGIATDNFGDYRNDAAEYLQYINDGSTCLCYLRRRGSGKKYGQQKWELTFAADNSRHPLPKSIADKNLTLKITGVVDGEGYNSSLFILDASFVDLRRGVADAFALALNIKFEPYFLRRTCLPDQVVSLISDLPDCSDHLPTADQLAIWDCYVAIERKLAEARQFCVPYSRHNFDSNASLVAFKIDADNATVSASEPGSLLTEEFWKRVQRAKNDLIKLVEEDDPFEDRRDSGRVIGRIEQIDRSGGFLRIRLEEEVAEDIDNGRMDIPRYGSLLFDAWGNITEVKRKELSLQDLRAGRAGNPFLGSFFFDSRQARAPEIIPTIHKWLDPNRVNEEQRRAVEKVMAAEDLALIWGPPGTGKTTVIAEICYQVALRGGRTLIASQTNLAVDNAMSRLVHDPSIRALRKGKAEKVEDEGRQYTEKYVIGTWLRKTSDHCQKSLALRREKVEIFRQLLADQGRLSKYLQHEEQHRQMQAGLWQRLETLMGERKSIVNCLAAITEEHTSIQALISELRTIQVVQANYSSPELLSVQERLMPLINNDPEVIECLGKVVAITDILTKQGVLSPDLPVLAKIERMQADTTLRRDEIHSQLNMIDLAKEKIALVNNQLEHKQSCEDALRAAQQEVATARTNEQEATNNFHQLRTKLTEEQSDLARLTFLKGNGKNTDWFSKDALKIQDDLARCFEQSDLFGTFREKVALIASIFSRLNVTLPELPPMTQAALCLQTLEEKIAAFGNLSARGEKIVSLTNSAQQYVESAQNLQIKKDESQNSVQTLQSELENLAKSAVTLNRNYSLISDAQQEFAGWVADLKGFVSLRLSMGISAESRLSVDILPAFHQSLNALVDQVGRDKVPWLKWCDQFVDYFNQNADRVRQQADAGRKAKDIRQLLDAGLNLIGSSGMTAFGAHQSIDILTNDFASIHKQANDLLSRIREPLGFFASIFGKRKRRRAEYAELIALSKRVDACLADVPSASTPNELQQVTSNFLMSLSSQGEEWFKRGIANYTNRISENDVAKNITEQELHSHLTAIRNIDKELAVIEGELRSFLTDLANSTENLHSVGLRFDPPVLGEREFLEEMVSYVAYATGRAKRWHEDIANLIKYTKEVNPVAMLDTLDNEVRARIDQLTVAVDKASGEMVSAQSLYENAEMAAFTAERLCVAEQDKWENNSLRILEEMEPFNSLPKESSLFKIISPLINTKDDVAVMMISLRTIKDELQKKKDRFDSILQQIKEINSKRILVVADRTLSLRDAELNKLINEKETLLYSRINPEIQSIESELERQDSKLQSERSWWHSTWESIPVRLREQLVSDNIHDPGFLRCIASSFPAWLKELEVEEAYLRRYESLANDWIARISEPSDHGAADLRRIYLANANVIGITCSQAAAPKFSSEFPEFDVVIIDEVSKCTPPELMMPALKGKKLVLVGDHRQLPPMIDDKTIEDLATDAGMGISELSFIRTSMFNTLYTSAAEQIKQDLRVQYRMHPSIMGVINQFYDHQLKCGITDVEKVRAHGLGGQTLKDSHHIVWVNTPLSPEYREQAEGTSFYNQKEIDAIKQICKQLDTVWASHIASGAEQKEIAIITFYLPQLRKIREQIRGSDYPNLNIRTGTVDRFQGMERPVVIVSLVRNNSQGSVGFAKSPERVNVAFSRAQELLMIVGCRELFVNNAPVAARKIYQEVSDEVRRHGGLKDVSDFCR